MRVERRFGLRAGSSKETRNEMFVRELYNNSRTFSESLILAQNERWQRGLGMQVERDPRDSNVER